MSGYLWKYYFEDDVDSFRHTLENATHSTRPGPQKGFVGWQGGSHGAAMSSSPASYNASPVVSTRGRKVGVHAPLPLTRTEINSRDATGLTILHHAASSTSESALGFARALLDHPLIDLYIQDAENGWTSLHRAFYFGNISIARLIMNRDGQDIMGHGSSGFNPNARGLVKVKDKEGYGPLDLFSMTIKDRTLRPDIVAGEDISSDDEAAQGESGDQDDRIRRRVISPQFVLGGDEVFTFGSNKNVTLGFGDEDDRQFPERIVLRRPDHLLQRFYREHRAARLHSFASLKSQHKDSESPQAKAVIDLPVHIRNTPIIVQDVQMSKLHSAILTTDPVSNLYTCGHGPGGRLGTGNETTRYQFVCIEGGGLGQKKIVAIALGQNHTLAITDEGELFSWGNNSFGQLGYSLPKPTIKDAEPLTTLPRQIFGLLKREIVIGVAASRIHSVAHTATSLYTFGKNEGQLGIVDSDARSLEVQMLPRKIAASVFSSPILSVSAIDAATICLLENRDVWVFANYGYAKVNFPLNGFSNHFLKESWLATKYDTTPNKIGKITSGGETICALSSSGEIFTVALSRRVETSSDASASTTNPKQIRSALSHPHRIWSAKTGHMAARDVDVDQDGSVILTTEAGTVWRGTKRVTSKTAAFISSAEVKPKDYKFHRVPGLTRVIAVRSSAYGAYAAIRKDCDVTRDQIGVDDAQLWKDLAPLFALNELSNYEEGSDDEDPSPRFWKRPSAVEPLRKRALKSRDLETEVSDILRRSHATSKSTFDMDLGCTVSEVRIPVHECMISGRSRIFRDIVAKTDHQAGELDTSDLLRVSHVGKKIIVLFIGVDFLTIFNLAVFAYTDSVVDFWNATREQPQLAFRYRTVRTELMRVASWLGLEELESAVRHMVNPRPSMHLDLALAVKEPSFFRSGDVMVDLADGEMLLHSDVLCQRCPFFDGLFRGRADGQWLAGRRDKDSELIRIDLTHVNVRLFELVVHHIYTDSGEEIFEEVTSEDFNDYLALDELLDHIMDVMSIANELMLDRLSQVCQRLIGRYVNARNVCPLLSAIAPSSVAEFKDAALEYVCLSLEAVMQNSSLDELDEDLLSDLNEVVRDNQLATLPFARSGRAEALLFDKYPLLAEKIERSKRAKVDAIVLSNKFVDADAVAFASFRSQSLEELSASPLRQRAGRKSRETKVLDSPATTPKLEGKSSVPDLIFEMSDGEDEDLEDRIKPLNLVENLQENQAVKPHVGSSKIPWPDVGRQGRIPSHPTGSEEKTGTRSPASGGSISQNLPAIQRIPGRPWGDTPLGGVRLDMKDIMFQTSSSKPSNMTLGLSQQDKDERPSGSFHTRVSQKQRKRQQQSHQPFQPTQPGVIDETRPSASPWQAVSQAKPHPISSHVVRPSESSAPSHTSSAPQLTMRQTVANNGAAPKQEIARQHQALSQSSNRGGQASQNRPSSASSPGMSVSTRAISTPHSIRHIPPPSHSPTSPSQHLSMTEILSIQQAEKDYVKDAASKRSLHEIQQEQEFQEWWDQESKRVMHEEEQRRREEEKAAKISRGRGRGRGPRGKGKDKDGVKAKPKEGKDEGRGKGSRDVSAIRLAHDMPGSKASTPRLEGGEGGKGKARPRRGGRGGGSGGMGQAVPREGSARQVVQTKEHG